MKLKWDELAAILKRRHTMIELKHTLMTRESATHWLDDSEANLRQMRAAIDEWDAEQADAD